MTRNFFLKHPVKEIRTDLYSASVGAEIGVEEVEEEGRREVLRGGGVEGRYRKRERKHSGGRGGRTRRRKKAILFVRQLKYLFFAVLEGGGKENGGGEVKLSWPKVKGKKEEEENRESHFFVCLFSLKAGDRE